MTPQLHPLDEVLPLFDAPSPTVLLNTSVLEVTSAAQLLELARDPRVGRFLLARLSDTAALVDPGHDDDLAKALRAAGHTPKMAKGMES